MLVKDKTGYARVELLPDGVVMLYHYSSYQNKAMLDGFVSQKFDSIQELKDGGWEFLPPNLETMSVGDYVGGVNDARCKILMAQGVSKLRCYVLTKIDSAYRAQSTLWTAQELKDHGFIPLPWEEIEVKEVTMEEVCKKFGQEVKIKKDE